MTDTDRDAVERLIRVCERPHGNLTFGEKAEAAATLRALVAAKEAAEAERDGWASMVGQIVATLPLKDICTASSTMGELITYLKHALAERDVLKAEAAARIRELEAETVTLKNGLNAVKNLAQESILAELSARAPVPDEARVLLPRSDGADGWTLSPELLVDLEREVRAGGWDGCTAEVTEIIALSVERRIRSALSLAPVTVREAARVLLPVIEEKAAAIPEGHEDRVRGASSYNWWRAFVIELRALAGQGGEA